jgi:uncharacterized SAM-binding protein YcdF (DUF218 family)
MFLLRKIVTALLLPPMSPLLLSALGLLLLKRRPLPGRTLAWGGLLAAYLLSTPLVGQLLSSAVEYWPPLDLNKGRQAQAIVVLSGDSYFSAPDYGGDTIRGITLERVRYAALVARQTGLPVLTSGGGPPGHKPDAEAMRNALVREFAVTVRWVESGSTDTRENALKSAAILKPQGVNKVVLVTSASHMRRSVEEFKRAGFQVVPAPTVYATRADSDLLDLLPHPVGVERSRQALHELLGRFVLRIRGWRDSS